MGREMGGGRADEYHVEALCGVREPFRRGLLYSVTQKKRAHTHKKKNSVHRLSFDFNAFAALPPLLSEGNGRGGGFSTHPREVRRG